MENNMSEDLVESLKNCLPQSLYTKCGKVMELIYAKMNIASGIAKGKI